VIVDRYNNCGGFFRSSFFSDRGRNPASPPWPNEATGQPENRWMCIGFKVFELTGTCSVVPALPYPSENGFKGGEVDNPTIKTYIRGQVRHAGVAGRGS
jgi:hypothetical protein